MKKFVLEVVFAVFVLFLSQLAATVIEPYAPKPYNFLPGLLLVWALIKASDSDGYKRGESAGYELGHKEGWEAARKAGPFAYNDSENSLPDGFFYTVLSKHKTRNNQYLYVVSRESGSDEELSRFFLVTSGTTQPLPNTFIMKGRIAEEWKPGGNSQY